MPDLVAAVREFVDRDVRRLAPALEHADRYPREMVERMKRLGLFGALVPAPYGGLGLDVSTYARIIEELCRGFMSLAGVINSHTMAALIVLHHGTEEQRLALLRRHQEHVIVQIDKLTQCLDLIAFKVRVYEDHLEHGPVEYMCDASSLPEHAELE